MGYTTTFKGRIEVEPPLGPEERRFLVNFSATRRMKRKNGPYYCGLGFAGQAHEPDIIDYNEPPEGQPGLWCHWVPTHDGEAIVWDGGEKFYNAAEWMQYIIDHFLKPGAIAVQSEEPFRWARVYKKKGNRPATDAEHPDYAPGVIAGGHVLNGIIHAQGERRDDKWDLVVKNNRVQRTPPGERR